MSKLNQRKPPRVPIETQKPGRPTAAKSKPSRNTLDKGQAAFERKLHRKDEQRKDELHRDIQKARQKVRR